NVVQVGLVAPRPRLGKAHVANPAGHLREMLRGNFGIRLPAYAMVPKETVDLGISHRLATDQIDRGFPYDPDIFGGIEAECHGGFFRRHAVIRTALETYGNRLYLLMPQRMSDTADTAGQISGLIRLCHAARIENAVQFLFAKNGTVMLSS